MKKLAYLLLLSIFFIGCEEDEGTTPNPSDKTTIKTINISVGSGYANDIYFSLANGVVATKDRAEWDIAFYTGPMTSSIHTNDGNGVVLYVADAIANWDNVTSIPESGDLYNVYSDTTWENGAFDQNIHGEWDYGWGYYDITTHTVTGDSVHVIKFADGTAKKLIIEKRNAATNAFHIKYANLDGTEEVNDIISCGDYSELNMIHYSIKDQIVVEHEPAKNDWDLMFTKYADLVSMGPTAMAYPVTGVLSNNKIQVAKVMETDTSNNEYSTAQYSKAINSIGYQWKNLNTDYTYSIADSVVYFVQDRNENYYKIVFTGFEGSSTGNIEFKQTSYKK